jgi:hypothetical protein
MTEPTDQGQKEYSEKELDTNNREYGEKDTDAPNGDSAGATEAAEDTEGMDVKAKALMHLLKTSSVSRSYCLTDFLRPTANSGVPIGLRCYHVREDEETTGRS